MEEEVVAEEEKGRKAGANGAAGKEVAEAAKTAAANNFLFSWSLLRPEKDCD